MNQVFNFLPHPNPLRPRWTRFTRSTGRVNFFGWLFQFTAAVVAAVVVGWVPLGGWVWWVPLGGSFLFLGVSRGVPPRLAAWWVSLVGVATTGGAALAALGGTGVVTPVVVIDSVGAPYVFLTVTLIPLVVLASFDPIRKNQVTYYFWVLFLGGC